MSNQIAMEIAKNLLYHEATPEEVGQGIRGLPEEHLFMCCNNRIVYKSGPEETRAAGHDPSVECFVVSKYLPPVSCAPIVIVHNHPHSASPCPNDHSLLVLSTSDYSAVIWLCEAGYTVNEIRAVCKDGTWTCSVRTDEDLRSWWVIAKNRAEAIDELVGVEAAFFGVSPEESHAKRVRTYSQPLGPIQWQWKPHTEV